MIDKLFLEIFHSNIVIATITMNFKILTKDIDRIVSAYELNRPLTTPMTRRYHTPVEIIL